MSWPALPCFGIAWLVADRMRNGLLQYHALLPGHLGRPADRARLLALPLLQDTANATLRLETLCRNCVQCNNRKRWCKKPSKKVQNICDGGCIKHGSDFSCVCDAGHTVQFNELFAMRKKNGNGQPDESMCDIRHIVQSD